MKILFVCHGNICRSPMAEFALKDLLEKSSLAAKFEVESAAVSSEELGNPVYPPAREVLAKNGISCEGKRARKMSASDYEKFDLILCMDADNIRRARAICGGDPKGTIRLLLELAGEPRAEVADPWYTGDFDAAWRGISKACRAIIEKYGAEAAR